MQFAAFGDLHGDRFAQNFLHTFGKWCSSITTVTQQTLYLPQTRSATLQGLQCTVTVSHFRCRHRNGMRQPQGINSDMALDARHLLAGVIAFLVSRVRILHTLRVHNQERAASVAPLFLSGRANLIFLMPAPARSRRAGQAHSICANRHIHSAIWETLWAKISTGNQYAADTAQHKILHTNLLSWVWYCASRYAIAALSRQTSLC